VYRAVAADNFPLAEIGGQAVNAFARSSQGVPRTLVIADQSSGCAPLFSKAVRASRSSAAAGFVRLLNAPAPALPGDLLHSSCLCRLDPALVTTARYKSRVVLCSLICLYIFG
jgi:hypothetical protein